MTTCAFHTPDCIQIICWVFIASDFQRLTFAITQVHTHIALGGVYFAQDTPSVKAPFTFVVTVPKDLFGVCRYIIELKTIDMMAGADILKLYQIIYGYPLLAVQYTLRLDLSTNQAMTKAA